MDRDNKKRGRGGESKQSEGNKRMDVKNSKEKQQQQESSRSSAYFEDGDIFKTLDSYRPLRVFEFPWQKDSGVGLPESTGWDFGDVFFSSLVDGCSAQVGIPGDRICRFPAPILMPYESFEDGSWLSEVEVDDVDCTWKAVHCQPRSF